MNVPAGIVSSVREMRWWPDGTRTRHEVRVGTVAPHASITKVSIAFLRFFDDFFRTQVIIPVITAIQQAHWIG